MGGFGGLGGAPRACRWRARASAPALARLARSTLIPSTGRPNLNLTLSNLSSTLPHTLPKPSKPTPQNPQQVSIVDTPGILSGEKQRIERTYDFCEVRSYCAIR